MKKRDMASALVLITCCLSGARPPSSEAQLGPFPTDVVRQRLEGRLFSEVQLQGTNAAVSLTITAIVDETPDGRPPAITGRMHCRQRPDAHCPGLEGQLREMSFHKAPIEGARYSLLKDYDFDVFFDDTASSCTLEMVSVSDDETDLFELGGAYHCADPTGKEIDHGVVSFRQRTRRVHVRKLRPYPTRRSSTR
jgi:hypothetical protein